MICHLGGKFLCEKIVIRGAVDTMWLGKFSCHHVRLPEFSVPSFDWFVEKYLERFRRVTRGSWRLVRQGCKAKDGPTGLEVSAA